ncbi:hypothetical protein [Psychroflexus torquis]|uniref:RraA family protein n=1 Tax=Psychroflexus torquis TaxID=57029 RepID=UPI0012FBA308|nr:hypothetical protein [Psychroflexus torquis]
MSGRKYSKIKNNSFYKICLFPTSHYLLILQLLSDQLVTLAIENKWNGITINACLRDSQLINFMEIGIRALNTSQVKSIKHNSGEIDSIVKLGVVYFISGDYIYVDLDGILVCKYDLIHKILKNKR